ncbi:MAG: adenosine deaminase [Elusimicrobiota bacterium]|nr:adenosine deaminase [Elusimicrobiota bacterium]
MNFEEFIYKLPKVDLHRHLDGSVRVETIRDAALEHGFNLPTQDIEELRKYSQVSPDCKSLTDFLKTFDFFYEFLKFPDVLERIAYENCEDAAIKENIKYLELRFAPPLQTRDDFTEEEVVKSVLHGIKYGQKKFGIRVGIILCLYRYHTITEEQNWKTLKLAEKYLGNGVVGIDLAGDESKFSVLNYKKFFEYARSAGIPITCHAGEAASAVEVKHAIELGAKRIGHGTHIYEDENIMKLVRDNDIALEICLTSNIQTQVVDNINLHPARKYYDYGIKITLNTDDPSVSGIDLNYEFQLAVKVFNFDLNDLRKIVYNSIKAAFLAEEEKSELISKYFNNSIISS